MIVFQWLRQRMRILLWVIRNDSTAFAEALSGFALVLLRGLMLLKATPDVPYDVSQLLGGTGITEARWGTFLILCGLGQILLVGSRHSLLRLALKILIVGAFAIVIAAYRLTDNYDRPVVLSLICILAFYTGLMIRVFRDRRRGVLSLEERHAAERR